MLFFDTIDKINLEFNLFLKQTKIVIFVSQLLSTTGCMFGWSGRYVLVVWVCVFECVFVCLSED